MSNTVLYRAACAVVSSLVISSLASAAITIETVPVGNAGNAADTTGYGAVAYEYNIGKYEVTAGQYAAFLTAVAATDTYALYNTSMSNTSTGSGIARSGSSGSYTYSVDPAFVNRPVNYVGLGDSMRFANWLHNGQLTGAQTASTTEDGTYFVNGANSSAALYPITRKSGATWAVTSEDEWYKAAYHKNNGIGASYFMYPTSSNTAPGRDMADASGNNVNIYGNPYPIDSGKYTTLVGEFQGSKSPYNTFDQGGNVFEWNEAQIGGSYRGVRGGAWNSDGRYLRADFPDGGNTPGGGSNDVGFRVSQVPEPGSMAVLVLGVSGLLVRRRGAGR